MIAYTQYTNTSWSRLVEETMNETQLNTFVQAIRDNQYIVGSVTAATGLSFASNPAIHNDSISARAECQRLTKISPGKMFVFVRLTGAELIPATQSISI